jgi:hypothetical protein
MVHRWCQLPGGFGSRGTAIAVTIKPLRTIQLPLKLLKSVPFTVGAGTSKRAWNVLTLGLTVISTSSNSSRRPVSGYQVLYNSPWH